MTAAPIALCLAGPTASGKTQAALAIAQALPVEIVSVDSALVYRGLDIGTAKPTPDERAAVPHHLIDIRNPADPYSAAAFVTDARRLIAEIHARGRWPLLVGGTMLYFKALVEGLDAMPAADASIRAALEARGRTEGWPALHAELARVDPATATRLAPHDAQRIQRALEVWQLSGRPISAWHSRAERAGSPPVSGIDPDEPSGGALPPPFASAPISDWSRWPLLSLEPDDRTWLHTRIAARLDAMIAAGFLDEVSALRQRGDLDASMPSMRCVGYRQAWAALEAGNEQALAHWPTQALAATRQLAKRQITWLRSLPQRQIIPCDAPDATAIVVAQARQRLADLRPGGADAAA